jgi:hypothetical protein
MAQFNLQNFSRDQNEVMEIMEVCNNNITIESMRPTFEINFGQISMGLNMNNMNNLNNMNNNNNNRNKFVPKHKPNPNHIKFTRYDDTEFDKYLDELFKNDENKLNNKIVKKQVVPCGNPLCNHKTFEEDPNLPNILNFTTLNTLDDLISLGKSYHCKKNTEYHGVSLKILSDLVAPLTELNEMIGMKSVKESMIQQIFFCLQGFNKKTKCNTCASCACNQPCQSIEHHKMDMMHTVITGPPGCGKTNLGSILGKVYKAMGLLENGKIKIVARSDLIGKYLGHTAAKTQEVINDCKGGVMFIDEAYSLGNKEGRDIFSKECLDTLNQNLSEKRDFLCIIAGYKHELDTCFFSGNPGLRRRFTFQYDIESYNSIELRDIFLLKVIKDNWDIECVFKENDSFDLIELKRRQQDELTDFFNQHIGMFPHFGGDIETLFLNCKIYHSKRVLFLDQNVKKVITMADIKQGFDTFVSNRKYNDKSNVETKEEKEKHIKELAQRNSKFGFYSNM